MFNTAVGRSKLTEKSYILYVISLLTILWLASVAYVQRCYFRNSSIFKAKRPRRLPLKLSASRIMAENSHPGHWTSKRDNLSRQFSKEKHAQVTQISNQFRKLLLFTRRNQGYIMEDEGSDFEYPVVMDCRQGGKRFFLQCFPLFNFSYIENQMINNHHNRIWKLEEFC